MQQTQFDSDVDLLTYSCTHCRERHRVIAMELGVFDDGLGLLCDICRVTMRLEGRWKGWREG